MWHKISIKGVVIGAVVDVIGTNIWGFLAGIYVVAKYQLYSLPHAEQTIQLHNHLLQDPTVSILNMIIGGGFTIIGGYIAARIAKHDELLNGTVASFLCVIFALLAIGSSSILWVIVGIVINPILGFVGGYLRLWQKKRSEVMGSATIIQAKT